MKTLHGRIKEHSSELIKKFSFANQELKDLSGKSSVFSYKETFYDISDKFHIFDRCEVTYSGGYSEFFVQYFLNNHICVIYSQSNKRVYYTPHFLDSVIDTSINSVYDITDEDEILLRFEHDAKCKYAT